MGNTRVKIKIGEHEFEAEGPPEIVQAQFETFKKFIETAPKFIETAPKQSEEPKIPPPPAANNVEVKLDRICHVDGRVISLTVKPESDAEAALLVMLGQRVYRENEAVTASEINDGLEQSGYRIERLDRVMKPLLDEGSLVTIGFKKGTRYRFTNPGLARAQTIAREVIAKFC
jgi:hypothetical protein